MDIISQVKENGIVGAGGAGFPTHIKLANQAEIVIVNAAECEPLLHKDKEILKLKTDVFLKGLKIMIEAVGAQKGIIGIKAKHQALIDFLKPKLEKNLELITLGDFYPAGDEITLIYETTGRVIKAGNLPITEGVIVNNVESIYNIGTGEPVTTKFLNIAGYVNHLNTFEVPLGISFREIIDYAKPAITDYTVLVGGPMMGKLCDNLDEVVTKTTSALIILPKDHLLVTKYQITESAKKVNKIGKSACDQCTICTELCPRYLLGHPIQPHQAMRSLVFSSENGQIEQSEPHTLYCCECNLCSFISCPEGLFPSTVCINHKRKAAANGVNYEGLISNKPHPLVDYRKTPTRRLKTMLDLDRFEDKGSLVNFDYQPRQLKLLFKQHIGAPAKSLVKVNDTVTKGQKIATVADQLGSEIHTPMDGQIINITKTEITIQKER